MLAPYAFKARAYGAHHPPHRGPVSCPRTPTTEDADGSASSGSLPQHTRPQHPKHPPAPASCPASGLSPTPDYRLGSDQPPARAADANPLDATKSARNGAKTRRHAKNRYKGTHQPDTPRKSPENTLPDNPTPHNPKREGVRGGRGRPFGPSRGRTSHNRPIMRRDAALHPPLDITKLCQHPPCTHQHRSAAGRPGPRFALPPGPPLAADTLPEHRTRKQGARSGGRVRPRRATRSPSAVTRPDAHGATSCPSTSAPTPPKPVHAQSNASTASGTPRPSNSTSKKSLPTSARPGASAESQNPPEKAARERLAPKPAPKADTRPGPGQGPPPRRPGRDARPQPASRQHGQPHGTAEGQPPTRTRTRNRGCPAKSSRHIRPARSPQHVGNENNP